MRATFADSKLHRQKIKRPEIIRRWRDYGEMDMGNGKVMRMTINGLCIEDTERTNWQYIEAQTKQDIQRQIEADNSFE